MHTKTVLRRENQLKLVETPVWMQHCAEASACEVIPVVDNFIYAIVRGVKIYEQECFLVFLLWLLVLQKYKSESGTFVTGTIFLTVGIYALECIKEVEDTVSIFVLVFMNNFHNSAENKLSQRKPPESSKKKERQE